MEAHFVHFNSKYGTIEEAQKHADGLAVVGFLLMVRTYKSRAAYVDKILLIVLDLFNINNLLLRTWKVIPNFELNGRSVEFGRELLKMTDEARGNGRRLPILSAPFYIFNLNAG